MNKHDENCKNYSNSNIILENEKKENINIYFQKTLKNTISAFLLSLITTIINFICNIPLLRTVSKESYGLVKVHLELAFSLVNYIPRETIRRTSQKFCPDKNYLNEVNKYYIICQLNCLIFMIIIIFSIIIFFCFMLFVNSELLHKNYLHLIIYIICGLAELLIEPIILYMNLNMENKFLPITISSLSRVVTNSIFISIFNLDLWGFTLSRIIGTIVYISYIFCLGVFKYKVKIKNFIPIDFKSLIFKKYTKNGINTLYLREVYFQFIKLNMLNFILFKCQNISLSFILKSSNEEKSDYSFISQNYSLITRFLFEPIVDAFYNLVNKVKFINVKEKDYNNTNNIICSINNRNKAKVEAIQIIQLNLKQDDKEENQIIKESKNEINYNLAIKLLQLFLKIFTIIGTLIIPYYILIGKEFMGLIYGKKWETNNIDKIGDCYSYYIILASILDLIKSFGNATNDTHQMNLFNLSLIINAIILSLLMYIFSKWDICGIIISNEVSSIFLININLYIIFCGRNKNFINNKFNISSIFLDIENYIRKCFVSKKTIIISIFFIILGNLLKKIILLDAINYVKILTVSLIGLIHICILFLFERQNFMKQINSIKSY